MHQERDLGSTSEAPQCPSEVSSQPCSHNSEELFLCAGTQMSDMCSLGTGEGRGGGERYRG